MTQFIQIEEALGWQGPHTSPLLILILFPTLIIAQLFTFGLKLSAARIYRVSLLCLRYQGLSLRPAVVGLPIPA